MGVKTDNFLVLVKARWGNKQVKKQLPFHSLDIAEQIFSQQPHLFSKLKDKHKTQTVCKDHQKYQLSVCNCCLLSYNAWHTKVSLPYRANPALSPLSPWEQLRSRINHWDIRYYDSIVSPVLAMNNYLLSYSWPSRDSNSTLLHYSLDILSTLRWPWNHIYLLCMSKQFRESTIW